MEIVLSTAYLPPLQYLQKIVNCNKVYLEKHENYIKQSYRNRCSILAANGVLDLSIPLQKLSDKEKICDKKISYHSNWQQVHWRSIESAYRNSPYFDFFEDGFRLFYEKQFVYLFDFNLELLSLVFKILRINPSIHFTEKYEAHLSSAIDFRSKINPKYNFMSDPDYLNKAYYQVFADKHGFTPNLSIIDVLFNEGKQAKEILLLPSL